MSDSKQMSDVAVRKDILYLGYTMGGLGAGNTGLVTQMAIRGFMASLPGDTTTDKTAAAVTTAVFSVLTIINIHYMVLAYGTIVFSSYNGNKTKYYMNLVTLIGQVIVSLLFLPFSYYSLSLMDDGTWVGIGAASVVLLTLSTIIAIYLMVLFAKEVGPCCGSCGKKVVAAEMGLESL